MKKIAFLLILCMFLNIYVFSFYDQEDVNGSIYEPEYSEPEGFITAATGKEEPKIYAPAAIVLDRKYDRVVFGKNIHEKRSNASTTKIMTAIVAYENGKLDDKVKVSKRAARTGGSTIGLNSNDETTLNDLMYGLLICSGNDAAVAIAEYIAGDVESFCEMMNEKAREIGAYDTNFVSPHGLDNPEHYSTAYDLAIMADYALEIPYIANIVKTKKAIIYINNRPKSVYTTNEMLSLYNGADGVKTGYTSDAGRCLVTSATKGDYQYISVILGCDTKKQRTNESIKILNYSFDNFKYFDACEKMKKEFKIKVEKSYNKWYLVTLNEKLLLPLTENEKENIKFNYNIYQNCMAPLPKNSQIGQIDIMLGDAVIKTIPIKLHEEIERKGLFGYIYELIFLKYEQYRIKIL